MNLVVWDVCPVPVCHVPGVSLQSHHVAQDGGKGLILPGQLGSVSWGRTRLNSRQSAVCSVLLPG